MANIVKRVVKKLNKKNSNQLKKEERIRKKLFNCMSDYGVKYSEQLEKDVRTLNDVELKEKYGKLDVTVVSEITGESYRKTLKKMEKVMNRYQINFKTYANEKLYLYEGSELAKKVGSIKVRNEKKLDAIVKDTGWSRSKAIRKVAEFNEKWIADYKKYYGYKFNEKTPEEIQEKYDSWNEKSKKHRERVQAETGWPLYKVRVHMRRVAVQFDIIPDYYMLYRAWEMTDEQLATYATQKMSEQLMGKYNGLKEKKVLADKLKFDEVYKDYVNRKFWVNDNTTNYEEFLEFIDGVDEIFSKPIGSGGGLGTEKFKVDKENPRAQYEKLMSKSRFLYEECVKQHPDIDEFVDASVNTIRVITIIDEGECKVICTGMRFGSGGITDNFSGTGMAVDVDPETGIIVTDAIDKKGNTYKEHPISGKVFKGYQIPLWDQVIELAKNAMYVQENINYVGWDIAISEKGPVIIEANPMPDLILIQAPYANERIGKRYLFEKYL